MMKQQKAIIIGAGIGGLATAIRLAKQGMAVTVFEKNRTAGGRCQQIIRNGHVFDAGPTMYLFPKIYADFFQSIGEPQQKYFQLLKSEPTYQLNFADNTHFTLSSDLKEMKQRLETIEPGSYANFLTYISAAKKYYDFAMEQLIYNNLEKPWDYFNLKNLYLFLRHEPLKPHYTYVSKFFKHQVLRAAFTFQDSYLSLSPFESPAIFSMFAYSELAEGNFLPKGGMYKIIQALLKIAEKCNVKMVYQTSVAKINVFNNVATGITLEDKSTREADYIIVNADLGYAYRKLLSDTSHSEKLLKKKYSCSAIAFHWGIDKVYPQLKTHNLFFSKDYKQEFKQVIDHYRPPEKPHFYVQAPARTDKSRAPKNQDTLTVVVPINHIDPQHPVNWEKYVKRVRSYVISRLTQSGIKDIEKHIKFEIYCTPQHWQQRFNLTYGAVYGLHHNLPQLGYLREKRQHGKYKNVYFVGASTHPGSGLPTVLLSSLFTSQKVLNN